MAEDAKFVALLNLLVQRRRCQAFVVDVGIVSLELLYLVSLLLFLHQFLVFSFFLASFLLSSLSFFLSLLAFFSLFCDSFFSFLILFISFIFLLFADLELILHVGHPGDVLQQVLLFGVSDQRPVVSISKLFLLLVDLVSLVSQLLPPSIYVVKLLVESCLGLSLRTLAFFQLVDLSLKSFYFGFNFRQVHSGLFLGVAHRLELGLGGVFLLYARDGVL